MYCKQEKIGPRKEDKSKLLQILETLTLKQRRLEHGIQYKNKGGGGASPQKGNKA